MSDFGQPTALFGGSFDPVHEGHIHVANEVRKALPQIEQIVFVPASQSPGKKPPTANADQRLKWLRMGVQPDGFGVWDIELQRNGDSFTVDTLEQAHRLGAVREKLFFILGFDAFRGFSSWKNPERIRELCRLIVVNRPGETPIETISDDIFVPIPPHPASSSEIRAQLASGGSSPWLPEPVKTDLEKLLPLHNPYVRKI